MLDADACIWCGEPAYLGYGGNTFDDTMRSASFNSSGDLMCARCAEQEANEEMQDFAEDWEEDYP